MWTRKKQEEGETIDPKSLGLRLRCTCYAILVATPQQHLTAIQMSTTYKNNVWNFNHVDVSSICRTLIEFGTTVTTVAIKLLIFHPMM
jgi:hypothetical protein